MKKFKVLLNGIKFFPKDPTYPEIMGFYTAVYIKSADEESAKLESVKLLLDDEELLELFGKEQLTVDNLKVDEIDEIQDWEGNGNPERLGLSIYLLE